MLGKTSALTKHFQPNISIRHENPLEEVKTGTLIFSAEYIPLISPQERLKRKLNKNKTNINDIIHHMTEDEFIVNHSHLNSKNETENSNINPNNKHKATITINTLNRKSLLIGILTIDSIRCRNLRTSLTDKTHQLRPYIIFNIATENKQTDVIKKSTGDCSFTDVMKFVIRHINPKEISIVIKAKDYHRVSSHKTFGEITISLEELLASNEYKIEKEYQLQGDFESYISFNMSWIQSI